MEVGLTWHMELKKCLLSQISLSLDATALGCREPVTAMELESHLMQPYLRLPLALEISPAVSPPALPQLNRNPAGLLLGMETPKLLSHIIRSLGPGPGPLLCSQVPSQLRLLYESFPEA